MVEFQAFPKIPRAKRTFICTEKIDGSNAAILIDLITPGEEQVKPVAAFEDASGVKYGIWAQSRSRFIYPGKSTDNYGFAGWVFDNYQELAALGPGRHFGEWWGNGINRNYGLTEKRFSLFNIGRWNNNNPPPLCVSTVPVICSREGFDAVDYALDILRTQGSLAAPGYMNPEGVIAFHTASHYLFKATLKDDDKPKGVSSSHDDSALSESA